jgi:hypothetical protein
MNSSDLAHLVRTAPPANRPALLAAMPRRDRSPRVALLIGDKPASIIVDVPIRTVNPLNNRQHWRAVSERGKVEKTTMRLALAAAVPLPALPVKVSMQRRGKGARPMDGDGLGASLKHVRDSVADAYGLDDADTRIYFETPEQATRANRFGVSIVIQTRKDVAP